VQNLLDRELLARPLLDIDVERATAALESAPCFQHCACRPFELEARAWFAVGRR